MTVLDWPTRIFEFWSSTAQHGILVLRSNKGPLQSTRVEVIFRGVSGLFLASSLRNMSIEELVDEEAAQILAKLPPFARSGSRVYRIRADDFEGFVSAAHMQVVEDTREYFEPSSAS
jgi:hypothetical protein